MRQITATIAAAALVASLAAPALAQGTASGTSPAPAATSSTGTGGTAAPKAPAKAPEATAKPKHATGAVKSAAADSLVLVTMDKNKTEKEWSFVLDKDTKLVKASKAIEAKDIVAKDTATVAYVESDGKMVAKTVTIKATKTAAKPKTQS
jgi:hypothetical protein